MAPRTTPPDPSAYAGRVSQQLDVGLLGRCTFRVEGHPSVKEWPRPSARRLVTLLVLADSHVLSRDRIADALFAHLPPDRAARSVSRALSLARSTLGADLLAADATNIWIEDADVRCDLLAARDRLRDSVARPSASPPEPLPDQMVLADDPYEDWAIEVRDDLAGLHRTALIGRARATGSLADWQVVADADPSSEEACIAVARTAAAAGDRDAVIRALARCRRALADLDLRPSDALAAEIRGLADTATARKPSSPRPVEAPRGRSREVARMVQALAGDVEHARGAVLISGPAGIGKSRLVSATTAALRADGWLVGVGTAVPEDARSPLTALRTALRGLLDDEATLSDDLDGDSPAGPDGLADDIDAALGRLAAEAPVLLVVDDLHWTDATLQELLVRVAGRTQRAWALLMAARSDEPGHSSPTMPTAVETITLGPLADDDARRIVHDEAPDLPPDDVAALVERAAGNPFFLVELTRHRVMTGAGDRSLPGGVSTLVAQRVDALTSSARRLLDHLALLGEDASFDVLERLADDTTSQAAHIDELLGASLIQPADDGLRLRHPLVREQVLAGLNPLTRGDLHAAAAETFEAVAASRVRGVGHLSRAAARHRLASFLDGGRRSLHAEAAARAGFDEGRRAAHLLANDVAAELLEGALSAYQHVDADAHHRLGDAASGAWRELGHARLRESDVEAARQAYEASLATATSARQRARGWRALAWIPYRTGDFQAAVDICRKGLEDLGDDPLARASLVVELAWVRFRAGEVEEAVDLLQPSAELAEEAGEWGLAARALDRLAVALQGAGRLDEARGVIASATAAALRAGTVRMQATTAMHGASILRASGNLHGALAQALAAMSLCEGLDDDYMRSVSHWVTAEVREALGDFMGAIADRDAEIRLLTPLGNTRHIEAARRHRDELLKAAASAARDGVEAEPPPQSPSR